jgi:hypothetical protein
VSQLKLREMAADGIATPAASKTAVYVDATDSHLKWKDDTGRVRGGAYNCLTSASQALVASTRTYLTGSLLRVPKQKLQVGTHFRWGFAATKTAAGTATSTIDIAVGTAGTTADTARVSFTKPAGTAAADEAWFEIDCLVQTIGATGVLIGTMRMVHNLASTGHAVIPCVVVTTTSAGFDMTVADLIVGVCFTSGASDAITISGTFAEALDL